MTYRDELAAAMSRIDALERELAGARQDAAELGAARTELARLRTENAALHRTQYALPRAQQVRLVVGLALAALTVFPVVTSWGAEDGLPPFLALDSGPVAAVFGF